MNLSVYKPVMNLLEHRVPDGELWFTTDHKRHENGEVSHTSWRKYIALLMGHIGRSR